MANTHIYIRSKNYQIQISNTMCLQISGVQGELQWWRPGHGCDDHRLQLLLPGFMYRQDFHHMNPISFIVIISTLSTLFPVGAPVPDIQRAPVLLSSALLAQYGGRAHEVFWQGNHHKVIMMMMMMMMMALMLIGNTTPDSRSLS